MKKIFFLILILFLLLGLPLLGIWIGERNIECYLQFPPRKQFMQHAAFSWTAFIVISLLILITIAPFILKIARAPVQSPSTRPTKSQFPWWGWAGVILFFNIWILAWTRFSWFAPLQAHTFAPLWVSYILVVNALSYRRTGKSAITHEPVFFIWLFIASSVFWWFFEYWNRFVQNWYYIEVAEIDAVQYFWRASLSFSTVLPAVYSTRQWLGTFPSLCRGLHSFIIVRLSKSKAAILAILSGLVLFFLGVWPNYLFLFVWIAPLVIILFVFGKQYPTFMDELKKGDWRNIWLWSLAALVCGFFWEMWNSASLAKWVYSVPFVNRFKLFEMPILGYAGYMPFGLECALIVETIRESFINWRKHTLPNLITPH